MIKHPEQTAKNDLLHKILADRIEHHAPYICGRVLDIGCGQMPYVHLFDRVTKRRYIGIDIQNHKGSVTASGEALPFRDAVFDSVLCLQVLEHVREPKQLFSEAYRVLKSNGVMLLTTPFMWGIHSEPVDFYRYTPYAIEYLSGQAGFNIKSIEADSGFWLLMSLRLNYYLSRLNTRLLNPLFWLLQRIGYLLDRLDTRYSRRDTTGFTTILIK